MSTTVTGLTLFNRAAKATATAEPAVLAVTGGSTTTLAASAAAVSKTSSTAYNGVNAVITSDAGGASGAPENEARPVSSFSTSGPTWTVPVAFTAAPANGDTAVLLYQGITQNMVYDSINDIILNLPMPRYLPATLVPYGAEPSHAGWADASGTPTQSTVSTGAEVLTGTQSLKVDYTVVDTSVNCSSIPVTEGERLIVWAPLRCTAGSIRLVLYDQTNGAEIQGVTIDETAWTLVYFEATVPSGCQNVRIRLQNKTTVTAVIMDHCGVLSRDRQYLDLHSTVSTQFAPQANAITDTANIEGLSTLRLGQSSTVSNSYIYSGEFDPFPIDRPMRDFAGVYSHRLELPRAPTGPLFFEYRQVGTAISTMTGTTTIPEEVIVEGMLAGIYKRLAVASSDTLKRREHEESRRQHSRAYYSMLANKGLNEAIVRVSSQRRVAAH